MWSKIAAERRLKSDVPATPFDATLSLAVYGPMVVSKILHGEGVLTQCLLILTMLTPDLVKVAHCQNHKMGTEPT